MLYKTLFIIAIVTAHCGVTSAQKLKKNEVDAFTGEKIKATSFETLCQTFNLAAHASATSINDSSFFIRLRVGLGSTRPHVIEKDAIFFLKLIDDSVIELHNKEQALSCSMCKPSTGHVTHSSETIYSLNETQVGQLLAAKISKIRIYTSAGSAECKVRLERTMVIKNELSLLKGIKIYNDDY